MSLQGRRFATNRTAYTLTDGPQWRSRSLINSHAYFERLYDPHPSPMLEAAVATKHSHTEHNHNRIPPQSIGVYATQRVPSSQSRSKNRRKRKCPWKRRMIAGKSRKNESEEARSRCTATEHANTRIARSSASKSNGDNKVTLHHVRKRYPGYVCCPKREGDSKSGSTDATATEHAERRQQTLADLNLRQWEQFRRIRVLAREKRLREAQQRLRAHDHLKQEWWQKDSRQRLRECEPITHCKHWCRTSSDCKLATNCRQASKEVSEEEARACQRKIQRKRGEGGVGSRRRSAEEEHSYRACQYKDRHLQWWQK